jgi:predicted nucleic acid-binding protein
LSSRYGNGIFLSSSDIVFFSANDLVIVEISPQVIERALLIRPDTSLRTPDAIQAESALTLTDRSIFVTGDAGFARIPGLFARFIQ